ncbi:unnamed protein product (macronuclear) [Paramecium tetraurelia]|uniref:SH3 domain-containing protein n=1 Tax=Paramecium tetraurelia TaxID=5888 RepID=A0C4P4_PARTE|nr:uncharacterized protein GSPATT00006260001 [Paramecium tetraurelia]CAK65761.1 unnamed protein product [Paramecium tetraurelia]|eukprot:XP_001433158.1 hypothetical protein (macronuclear) [Paramecium tetraurelia strain d4-2]
MEQFDSFNPVSIRNILVKIENIGFISPNKQISLYSNVLMMCHDLIVQFIKSKQQSLICFFIEFTFQKYQSKSKTYEIFNSYLNSLEQHNTKLSAIFLYLFQTDQCRNNALLYQKCNQTMRDFTKIKKEQQLDDVTLKFNDIITISQLIFDDITVDQIIHLLTDEVMKNSQTLNPLLEISASHLIQLLILYKQASANSRPFSTPKRSPKKDQKSQSPKLQGFYRWGSPFFSQNEFYKNPLNQRLLEDLEQQAKKYPKTRLLNSQYNYYSPLTPNKTRSDFESKDSVVSDFIKIKSNDNSKKQSPSVIYHTESSFSEKKQDPIKQSGCLYNYEVPQTQQELLKIIQMYSIQYFDPSIELPQPLDVKISYEHLIDLYTELEQEVTFRKTTYRAKQYFASIDPRYLQINKNEKIEAISQVEGWILGKNEFGHIGCCADSYIQKL